MTPFLLLYFLYRSGRLNNIEISLSGILTINWVKYRHISISRLKRWSSYKMGPSMPFRTALKQGTIWWNKDVLVNILSIGQVKISSGFLFFIIILITLIKNPSLSFPFFTELEQILKQVDNISLCNHDKYVV